MKNQRLLELDALRGIAAIAVLLYHYFFRYNEIYGHHGIPTEWANWGQFGVNLFFMVSGFVIFWTLIRVHKPLDFIVSRFSRLYPVYWAAILLTFSIVTICGLPGREVTPLNAFANVLMFQEYLRIPHVDPVYWTLTIELTFYFWIFLFFLIGLLDKVEWAFAFVILVSDMHSLRLITIHPAIYKIFLLKELPFFTAGICAFKVTNNGKQTFTLAILLLSLISTAFIYSWHELLIFAFLFVMLYLAVSGKLGLLSVKPLVFVGTLSYSLYLIHQNIGYVIINRFYAAHLHPLAGIAAAMAVSVSLAFALTKFVEGPAQRYLRARYRQSERIQRIAEKFIPARVRV